MFYPLELNAVLIDDRLVLAAVTHYRNHLDAVQCGRLFDEVAHAAVQSRSKRSIFEMVSVSAEEVGVILRDSLTQDLIVDVRVTWIQIFDMQKVYVSTAAVMILESKLHRYYS